MLSGVTMVAQKKSNMSNLVNYQDFPLAHTQKSVWAAMQQMESNTNAFKIPIALELNGSLNVFALESALNALVKRHEALRTLYPLVNGSPIQRVFDEYQPKLTIYKSTPDFSVDHFIQRQLALSLDPASETIRASLLKIKEDQYILFVDIHHLSFDGWSIGIFAKELYGFYNLANSIDKQPVQIFNPIEYQFADWSEWKNNSEIDTVSSEHWEKRLELSIPPKTIQDAYIANEQFTSSTLYGQLDLSVWRMIKEISSKLGVTTFEWLVSAWSFLISEYTHEKEIWVATPWANRDQAEFFNTIGCFIDTIPLRLDCSSDQFYEHVLKISNLVRLDLANAGFPSASINSLLRTKAPSGTSWQPSTMLALQLPLPDINQWDDLYVRVLDINNNGAKNDLALRIEPSSKDIPPTLALEYRNSLFSDEEAKVIMGDILTFFSLLVRSHNITRGQLSVSWRKRIGGKALITSPKFIDSQAPINQLIDLNILRAHWSSILNQPDVDDEGDFFMLGGDSILAIRLVARMRESGITCRARDIFENPTPKLFAKAISSRQLKTINADSITEPISSDELLPIEKWFFEIPLANHNHWAQAISIKSKISLDTEILNQAINAVQNRYPAFSWRWVSKNESIKLKPSPNRDCHFIIDRSIEPLENLITLACNVLNIATGPTSVVIVKEENPSEFLYFIHHLCVDTVSWHILIQDLQNYLLNSQIQEQKLDRRPILLNNANELNTQQNIDYWYQKVTQLQHCQRLLGSMGRYADVVKHHRTINPSLVNKIDALQEQGILLDEIFLAALTHLSADENSHLNLGITLESHGRNDDDPDAGITVGWHTVLAPFIIQKTGQDALEQLICITEDLAQWKRYSPSWLTCVNELKTEDAILPDISFNNLGKLDNQNDSIFNISPVTDLALNDPLGIRPFKHDVLLWRDATNLNLLWLADKSVDSNLIHAWLDQIENHLDKLFNALSIEGKRLPVSPLAEALLYHSEESGEKKSYIGQVRGIIEGNLDPTRFEAAWNQLIQRHQNLRSYFLRSEKGSLKCQIAPAAKIPLRIIDLSNIQSETINDLIILAEQKEIEQAIDIGCAPLSKLLLLKLNDKKWKFSWTHHHAIVDGWSLPVILDELLETYDTNEPLLKKLPPTPESIVRLQAEKNDEISELEWREILAKRTDSRPLPLPINANSPDIDIDLSIDENLTSQISKIAASKGVTSGSWYQAAWALVLQCLGAGSTPCFGTTVSGRDIPIHGIDQYVGLMINTLPTVVSIKSEELFSELAKQVHLQSAVIQNNAQSSLSDLQKMIPNEGEPIFDSLFVLENYPQSRSQGEHFQVSAIEMREQSHYPISLAVMPGHKTNFRLSLRTGRIEKYTGEYILELLEKVLTSSVNNPDVECRNIELFSDRLKHKLIKQSSSKEAFPSISIFELFNKAVNLYPSAIAVDDGLIQFSYADLLAKTGSFASAINECGVKRGSLISIISKRTIDLITAMIGISRIGAAYLTIDAELPSERILDLLIQSDSDFLLLDAPSATHFEELIAKTIPDLKIIAIKDLNQHLESTLSSIEIHPDDMAYLIYTSGSTGNPKRVAISNTGIANFAISQNEVIKNEPGERVYQLSSPSFDAFFAEISSALFFGATLCLPKDGNSIVNIDLVHELKKFKPTHIQITPSILNTLPVDALDHVRILFVCGEKPYAQDLLRWRAQHRQIFNAYGPCENTICASMSEWINNEDPTLGVSMRGVDNFLLTESCDLTIPGFIGQIYLGGPGLAWGYLNDPAQTAAKFVPNPWSNVPGSRLYATGDMAIRNKLGELEYIGRIDHQIKIHGQRIEIGEIESVIMKSAHCKRVHVDILEDNSKKRLAAWIEPLDSEQIDLRDVSKILLDKLPPAMVPSLWAFVQNWPLNASGKIDFKKISTPHPLSYFSKEHNIDNVENSILLLSIIKTWNVIFGLEVAPTDDLYSLGGDSITAMRLAARLTADGLPITAKDLMSGCTPIELAEKINAKTDAKTPSINSVNSDGPTKAPCSPIQYDFIQRNHGKTPRWVLCVELSIADNVDLNFLRSILIELANRHASLKASINLDTLEQTHVNSQLERIYFTRDPLLTKEIFSNARLYINASEGPGFAAAIAPGRLLLAAHHLWIDVVSLNIMVDELNNAIATGKINKVKSISYMEWSRELAEFTAKGGFDRQVDYWIRLFEHQSVLRKPLLLDTAVESSVVKTKLVEPSFLVKGKTNTFIESALLQALADTLTNELQPEILVELERHGRDALKHIEAFSIVGWFTASFPVRIKRNSVNNYSLSNLSKMLQNIPNGGAGFLALRRWRNNDSQFLIKTDLSNCCQLGFNFLGNLSENLDSQERSLKLISPIVEGLDCDPDLPRPRPLTVESWISNDGLHVQFTFDPKSFPDSEKRIQEFENGLLNYLKVTEAEPDEFSDEILNALMPSNLN